MKAGSVVLVALVAIGIGVGAGYWWGGRAPAAHAPIAAGTVTPPEAGTKKERKVLFYRNPMGLPDTSPTPKKDPMGMDYIPVYEGDEEPAAGGTQIKISVDKVQKLGVRSEPAALRVLDRVVRAAGRIEVDERRLFAVAPKFEGWVERLFVNATGQPVARGQPLFEAYSPELVSAQREYAIAAEGVKSLQGAGDAQAGMRRLAESSLARLRNWDISEDQVKALAQSGEIHRTLAFRSPVSGIVIEKKAVQGMRFMPGEALYQIADLSAVWVVADVFEQDIAEVRTGDRGKVTISAYPDRSFEGRVAYVYPTLKPETRTIPIRLELANPGQLLKPGMFAQVELASATKAKVVTVPVSAVIDSGTRRIVLIQQAEGRFEPRDVKVGRRSDDYVEIQDGVRDGERVVVAANFLIDAESNLKAAISGFGVAGGSPTATGPAQPAGSISHQADGTIDAIDAKTGVLTVTHGPVPSLKWPGMTMEFTPANTALAKDLKPGAPITFEFVERKPGEWVITRIAPRAAGGSGTNPKGH